MATIQHPHLGSITGKENDSVVEFLGLKYGSLRDRFAEASLFEDYGASTDTTSVGPSVAQKDFLPLEFRLLQHSLPGGQHLVSDTDGLRLNITTPQTLEGFKHLPVLVFIHGGNFASGSAMWPQYNMARLAKQSLDSGLPTVCVAINYRVGAPGFLISKEMVDAGIKGNRGLRDQRLALLWLRRHIAGFNGDPDNMTVVGHSAGAVQALRGPSHMSNIPQSSIFMLALGPRVAGIGAAFSESLDNSLADIPDAKEKILTRYGIKEQDDDAEVIQRILNFAHDAIFYVPAVALAKAWSGPAYVYHFNEPNPWDGPWKGRASHLTDIGFIFHNFDGYMTDAQRAVGARYASDLIEFANGNAPWPALGERNTARIYGPSVRGIIATTTELDSNATQRRTWAQEMLEDIGADRVNNAVHHFLAGQ
ncbi:hypothetical protein LCI18_014068 [Fusarium solani-melongenae]|uniref:Uncharacterized protein n=1 Tax=Fusarium solani subsp. cucurbitae TaxID=2747967 RepID=A0ACD3ZP62_FUSSC|nr:hypothetical protein LCI18_014068 [Fusarium solani-melongenae]